MCKTIHPSCLVVAHLYYFPFLLCPWGLLWIKQCSVHFLTYLQCHYQSNATRLSDSCDADHSAVMLSISLYHYIEVCLSMHAQQRQMSTWEGSFIYSPWTGAYRHLTRALSPQTLMVSSHNVTLIDCWTLCCHALSMWLDGTECLRTTMT